MIWKLELIKDFIRNQNRVVKYEEGDTICPVCEFTGILPSKVLVSSTMGEIRYCSCEQCGHTFRARGEDKTMVKVSAVNSTAKADKKKKMKHTENEATKKAKAKPEKQKRRLLKLKRK